MSYWLLKTEPEIYSWERLAEDKHTMWEGVRNYQARNNLREMKNGDLLFIYHSGEEKMIMGIARVIKEAYDDPTSNEGNWSVIDVEAVKELVRPVSLEEIKNTYLLNVMPLATQSRLSVQPVNEQQWNLILKIAKTEV
ncbi:EVE domain-containing protein [Patescibacteria group bacterium]|nr:EVE domain-containing protein [Patescibacteria group bacterium]MBU1034680.1 EVE domain-containing protein [Patescibacteria group bacterium]MBU1907611.1 EVE domain-containing protein [Patescibacteria group bacterium]